MSKKLFKLRSKFSPAGDQPKAIKQLIGWLRNGFSRQTLLGVTGSGKTFTMANVIEQIQKPTLVIAHNKTLAAQLAQEYRDFFPGNAVHYFVSYYDYYQPEAYLPISDTYIEKEAQINEEIDRLRHAATQALLSRRDVIIVASVSCIYGLGSPTEYQKVNISLKKFADFSRGELIERLVAIHFRRTNSDLTPGSFRVIGNVLEIMPTNQKVVHRLELANGKIKDIQNLNYLNRLIEEYPETIAIFPAKHFVTPPERLQSAMAGIKAELKNQLSRLQKSGKMLEAERLKKRTNYDLALIKEIGYCNGIENYSRHFSGRAPGQPPDTLLDYFPRHSGLGQPDFLTIIDESHVTLPQLAGMYQGDAARKQTLIENGFRLPSAGDNRPLTFAEFEQKIGPAVFTSATPGPLELAWSRERLAEQIIRPTGLLDPILEIKKISKSGSYPGQILDFTAEAQAAIARKDRVLVTTLTKKTAEDFSQFLKDKKIKSIYLHSDIKTLERIEILSDFRKGKFDCLVGVNLLREGLDLPEISLIGILDADKEGFLRSQTSLIQIIGRAARNARGRVILYADRITDSLRKAQAETERRRKTQLAYNRKHRITPRTISKKIKDLTEEIKSRREKTVKELLAGDQALYRKNPRVLMAEKERQMAEAVKILDFETAAILRDQIKSLIRLGERPGGRRLKESAGRSR